MKKCPFCAELIQDEAIKCKHCGEFLEGYSRPPPLPANAMPWYMRTATIVFTFLCLPPLAIPLIWWRPKTHLAWKIVLTIAILAFSWFLYLLMKKSIAAIMDFYSLMQGF